MSDPTVFILHNTELENGCNLVSKLEILVTF